MSEYKPPQEQQRISRLDVPTEVRDTSPQKGEDNTGSDSKVRRSRVSGVVGAVGLAALSAGAVQADDAEKYAVDGNALDTTSSAEMERSPNMDPAMVHFLAKVSEMGNELSEQQLHELFEQAVLEATQRQDVTQILEGARSFTGALSTRELYAVLKMILKTPEYHVLAENDARISDLLSSWLEELHAQLKKEDDEQHPIRQSDYRADVAMMTAEFAPDDDVGSADLLVTVSAGEMLSKKQVQDTVTAILKAAPDLGPYDQRVRIGERAIERTLLAGIRHVVSEANKSLKHHRGRPNQIRDTDSTVKGLMSRLYSNFSGSQKDVATVYLAWWYATGHIGGDAGEIIAPYIMGPLKSLEARVLGNKI